MNELYYTLRYKFFFSFKLPNTVFPKFSMYSKCHRDGPPPLFYKYMSIYVCIYFISVHRPNINYPTMT